MIRALLIISCLWMVAGCASNPPPPPEDEEGRIIHAKNLFAEGEYADVILVLQELIANRPGSRHVEEANFLIGRAYYEQGFDLEAEDQFRLYLRSFRGGQYEPDSQYHLALTLLSQSRVAMLDQSETRAALGEFRSFVTRFPDHALVERARGHIVDIRNKLSEKEYLNGKLYLKRGYHRSARFYFQEKVIDAYGETRWACPAALGLAQSYKKTKEWTEAARWANHYLEECGGGEDAEAARKIVAMAEKAETPKETGTNSEDAAAGSPSESASSPNR